jgi:multidrug transporter EmrE-like cation transporter
MGRVNRLTTSALGWSRVFRIVLATGLLPCLSLTASIETTLVALRDFECKTAVVALSKLDLEYESCDGVDALERIQAEYSVPSTPSQWSHLPKANGTLRFCKLDALQLASWYESAQRDLSHQWAVEIANEHFRASQEEAPQEAVPKPPLKLTHGFDHALKHVVTPVVVGAAISIVYWVTDHWGLPVSHAPLWKGAGLIAFPAGATYALFRSIDLFQSSPSHEPLSHPTERGTPKAYATDTLALIRQQQRLARHANPLSFLDGLTTDLLSQVSFQRTFIWHDGALIVGREPLHGRSYAFVAYTASH